MPELTVRRPGAHPAPMVCMYCGAPATEAVEIEVENRAPGGPGGGGDLTTLGDDPVSAVFGLLMLPFVLWELLKALADAAAWTFTRRAPTASAPAKPRLSTRVAITACGRHRRFGDRFVRAGAGMALALAALWAWALLVARRDVGTDHADLAVALLLSATFLSVLLPTALAFWYALAGPVTVDRVTEHEVVLDRVRQPYFDATGVRPRDAA